MSRVNCPYCGKEQSIDHDDGYGYDENEIHSQFCDGCDKYFGYTTYISFDYDVFETPCLNEDSEHNYHLNRGFPDFLSNMECSMCGEKRNLTDEEQKKLMKETNNNIKIEWNVRNYFHFNIRYI
jgi:hypothetical protein